MPNPNNQALLTQYAQKTVSASNADMATAGTELDSSVTGYLRAVYAQTPTNMNGGFSVTVPEWIFDGTNYVGIVTVSWYVQVSEV